ncbi:MAG TPA: tRNA pseudouridine(55) synthase TruB [Spongiibacteraceae bacterium]|nr:tRNA pseudouridine(55) synthase TruB [Spongiibacteraceae bacterium]
MARQRRGRPIDGILILDKPTGMTSNAALQTVKRLYSAAKAGHTGSLDPLATGVLPICFGEATKFSQYLLDADKTYRSTFVLGVTTASGDSDGEVLERRDAAQLTQAQVEAALAQFRGEIEQVPSMYSAIKKDGQPLYKLARQGIEVERAARAVTIFELRIDAFRSALENEREYAEVDIWVHCSKGTYVRSLAEDLGRALGCGAHVSKLRRVQSGPFSESDSVSLTTLEGLKARDAFVEMDALLRDTTLALGSIPKVVLGEAAGFYLRQGQPVLVPKAPTQGLVQLQLASGEFIGVGEILDDGRVAPRRLVNLSAGA